MYRTSDFMDFNYMETQGQYALLKIMINVIFMELNNVPRYHLQAFIMFYFILGVLQAGYVILYNEN